LVNTYRTKGSKYKKSKHTKKIYVKIVGYLPTVNNISNQCDVYINHIHIVYTVVKKIIFLRGKKKVKVPNTKPFIA